MADEITNRSFSKYSPFFSNFPRARVKSRATLGFSAMTSVLPICKVRFVRFPNSDRDSKGQPNRWQLIYCFADFGGGDCASRAFHVARPENSAGVLASKELHKKLSR